MKQILAVITLALIVAGGVFLATHHAVYGKCHYTPDGRVCTLIGYASNR
jgi:uncharacterized protein YxeA